MTIYVDGDACSVKGLILEHALKYNMKVVMVISVCHMSKENKDTKYIIVDNMSQSVDMTIINKARKNDIVVTDDYGLASILLGKKVLCLSNRGFVYTQENIEGLMFKRYMNMKIMRGGGRIKGQAKRNKQDDMQFIQSLDKVIRQCLYSPYV